MALERIGLGAVATLDNRQFVRSAGQARDAQGRLLAGAEKAPPIFKLMGGSFDVAAQKIATGARKIGVGVKQLGAGLRNAALGMLPLSFAVGAGIKTAASFEKQMSAVGAITRASGEDMAILADKAEEMGIKSVFSATESAQAMEFMARAGATTAEIVGGLSGVMAAAAAESVDLATSADIIAQATKIMGREWDQASNTADILVLTSAKTNTNLISLGEALRFGGQAAANMGYTLEETSATMGLLANAGLRGSIGGTSLMNMFNKLNKPTGKSQALMDKWNISLTNTDGSMRSMAEIVQQFKTRIDKIPDAAKRAGTTTEIFGVRGQRAFQALSKAGKKEMDKLTDAMFRASDGIGAAQEAALKRLDNFSGAVTLFSSSLQAASIKIFKPLLEPFKEAIRGVTNALNNVLLPLGQIRRAFSSTGKGVLDVTALTKKFGATSVDIAFGINDAIDTMIRLWNRFTTVIKAVSNSLSNTFGGDTIKAVAKWVVLIAVAAGVLAPVILALMALGFVISGLGTAFAALGVIASGAISIIGGVLAAIFGPLLIPILAIVGLLGLAFVLLRQEGESVGETLMRVWGNIKAAVLDFWNNMLKPFINGFATQWRALTGEISTTWSESWNMIASTVMFAVDTIKTTFAEMFGTWNTGGLQMTIDWFKVGKLIVSNIVGVIIVIIKVFADMVSAIAIVASVLFKIIIWPFKTLAPIAKFAFDRVVQMMEGDFLGAMINIGKAIFDTITAPFRLMLEGILKLAAAVKGIGIPKGLMKFAKEGFGTFVAPEPERQKRTVRLAEEGAVKVAEAQAKQPEIAEVAPSVGGLSKTLEDIGDLLTREKAAKAEPPVIKTEIDLTDKRTIDNKIDLCIDGEQSSMASERHKQEIQDRAGFKATPWQRRIAVDQGATLVRSSG